MRRTLLTETLNVLAENGKTFTDVLWIGCKEFQISKENFIQCADVEYDYGYGSVIVAADLQVVGADWWLERASYDGAEWWEYKQQIERPSMCKEVYTLVEDRISKKRMHEDPSVRFSDNDDIKLKYMVQDYNEMAP